VSRPGPYGVVGPALADPLTITDADSVDASKIAVQSLCVAATPAFYRLSFCRAVDGGTMFLARR